MRSKTGLGQQELELLRYVSENAPASVGEVAERYGEPLGLARSTIMTVMERLRQKGHLTRSDEDGVFRYSPRVPQSELLRGLVQEFVENTLGGSLTPFVAYLTQTRKLTDAQAEDLQRLVEALKQSDGPTDEEA